jgi:hypothetical protein
MAEVEDVVHDFVLGDNVDEYPLGWVAPGPRETASQITSSALGVLTIVEERAEGAPCHWRAWSPLEEKRVCSEYSEDGFAMYEYVFKELGLRLPFSDLAMNIFGHLKLAPSDQCILVHSLITLCYGNFTTSPAILVFLSCFVFRV